MKRKENSKHKLFNLDEDVITLVEQGSNINAMSQSEFIEFLVNSWDESVNPIAKSKRLRSKKKLLDEEIKEIDKELNLMMENMEKVEEWRKLKQQQKPEVIQNLVRILTSGRREDAEVVAKNQSVRLGIPAIQLLFEAVATMKKG